MNKGSPKTMAAAKAAGYIGGPMAYLPPFAGADLAAVKVELNTFRTAMITAGLMKSA